MFLVVMHAATMIGAEMEHASQLAQLPPEEREKIIAFRARAAEQAREERERKELLDAIKPHNLWSFLGLGKK